MGMKLWWIMDFNLVINRMRKLQSISDTQFFSTLYLKEMWNLALLLHLIAASNALRKKSKIPSSNHIALSPFFVYYVTCCIVISAINKMNVCSNFRQIVLKFGQLTFNIFNAYGRNKCTTKINMGFLLNLCIFLHIFSQVEEYYLTFNVFKSLFISIYTVFPYKYLQQFEFQKT